MLFLKENSTGLEELNAAAQGEELNAAAQGEELNAGCAVRWSHVINDRSPPP